MNYRDFEPYSKISSLTLGGGGIGQVWGETTSEEAIKTVHAADLNERKELFNKLVAKMYEVGQAIEAASFLEIDAVIDPIETRNIVLKAFQSAQGNR